MKQIHLVIVGGGPAGMSAAVVAKKSGIDDLLIVERDDALGGILNQCIHNGFGLHKFHEELTGPEYAARYEKMVHDMGIPYALRTTVLDITKDKIITVTNEREGIFQIKANAIVLAMGCRERPRGALSIAGTRPAGIYTAGTAQRFVNIKGYMPGKEIVILGSGDIGLIMARRMTLEGAKVKAVCELMPYSGGLTRNIVQCLNDFDIPLYLSHTVTNIHGKDRVTGVTVMKVDEKKQPIRGTEMEIACDTLLLSVGLIPENELSKQAGIVLDTTTGGAIVDQDRQTSAEGIFACGNVLHVHDLVDFVSDEAETAGRCAATYIHQTTQAPQIDISVEAQGAVRYVVPQKISKVVDVKLYFRVSDVIEDAVIFVKDENHTILSRKKQKVAPGEMESIILGRDAVANIAGRKLYIEVTKQ